VIGVYSAKGGVGKTLLATTLAQTLQLDYPLTVLLIDFNMQYGAVDSFLGLSGNRSLCDLIPVIGELNEGYLRNVITRVNQSQLDVLLSPSDAEKAEWIQPEHVQKLLRVARRYYDYIILDLPSHMDENTHMAIVESDKIVYVLTPEMPSLKAYRQTLDLFRKLSVDMSPTHLSVVFNMIHAKHELSVKELMKKKEIHTLGVIHENWKHIQHPINLGIPLRQLPNEKRISHYAKEIRKLAKAFVMGSQLELELDSKEQDLKKTKTSKLLPRFIVDPTKSDQVNM
jgi:pilus assembly protein CpaE